MLDLTVDTSGVYYTPAHLRLRSGDQWITGIGYNVFAELEAGETYQLAASRISGEIEDVEYAYLIRLQ